MRKVLTLLLLTLMHHQSTSANSDDETTTQPPQPLIVKSIDKANGLPKETQMAQCTVTSGDIKASAQATFSKKLEGFCSTQDMDDLNNFLSSIENRLLDEIYSLRKMVQSLTANNYRQSNYYQDNHIPPRSFNREDYNENYQQRRRDPPRDYNKNYYERDYDQNRQQSSYKSQNPLPRPPAVVTTSTTTTEKNEETSKSQPIPEVVVPRNMLKSIETPREKAQREAQTTTEVNEPAVKSEYSYLWRVENFSRFSNVGNLNERFSSVFNVKGLNLRIRAVSNNENDNLVLDIEHLANVNNAERFEVGVSDGFVFKEIIEEKLYQYHFSVIDETKPNHDLISPIYWNTDSDDKFIIPKNILLLTNYLKNDSILIKLVISF